MRWLYAPGRFVRDLPVGVKLATTTAGALVLLTGVSLFALDRLSFVTALQDNVAAQSAVEHQVQRSLLAAQELRVVSRELQVQQTVGGIRAALERAVKQTGLATTLMHEVKAGPDQALVDDALNFAGTAKMEASVSKMVGGWKGMLLKPADRLFKKDGAGTEVPIQIDGTPENPKFGIEFNRLKYTTPAMPGQPQ